MISPSIILEAYDRAIKQNSFANSFCCLCIEFIFRGADYLPSNILQMDPFFNHHILIAEKASHQLFLFEYNPGGTPLLIKKYPMAAGKVRGDKKYQEITKHLKAYTDLQVLFQEKIYSKNMEKRVRFMALAHLS